jgi:hypothetical protein
MASIIEDIRLMTPAEIAQEIKYLDERLSALEHIVLPFLVTKEDLRITKERLRDELVDLRQEMAIVTQEMATKKDLQQLQRRLSKQIATLRAPGRKKS